MKWAPRLAAAIAAVALLAYVGWSYIVAWHDSQFVYKIVEYCAKGCRVWVTPDGVVHALSDEDARRMRPQSAPAEPPAMRF